MRVPVAASLSYIQSELDAYSKRCEARPEFKKAIGAQLATFAKHTPKQATVETLVTHLTLSHHRPRWCALSLKEFAVYDPELRLALVHGLLMRERGKSSFMQKYLKVIMGSAALIGSLVSAQSSFALDHLDGSYKRLANVNDGAETTVLKLSDDDASENISSRCLKAIASFEKSNDPAADRYLKRVEGFRPTSEGCEVRYDYFSENSEPKQRELPQDYAVANSPFKRVKAYAAASGAVTLPSTGAIPGGGNIFKGLVNAENHCRDVQIPAFANKTGYLIEGFQVTLYPNEDGTYKADCLIEYNYFSELNVPEGY